MKPITFLLTLAAASLLSSPASPQDKSPEPSDMVKALQKRRIEALTQTVQIGLKLAQAGRLEPGVAVEDRMALLRAELEGVTRNADRFSLYTKALVTLREYEELAKAQHEAGRGTEYALLKIRATRLEVEIALENAKANSGRGGR